MEYPPRDAVGHHFFDRGYLCRSIKARRYFYAKPAGWDANRGDSLGDDAHPSAALVKIPGILSYYFELHEWLDGFELPAMTTAPALSDGEQRVLVAAYEEDCDECSGEEESELDEQTSSSGFSGSAPSEAGRSGSAHADANAAGICISINIYGGDDAEGEKLVDSDCSQNWRPTGEDHNFFEKGSNAEEGDNGEEEENSDGGGDDPDDSGDGPDDGGNDPDDGGSEDENPGENDGDSEDETPDDDEEERD